MSIGDNMTLKLSNNENCRPICLMNVDDKKLHQKHWLMVFKKVIAESYPLWSEYWHMSKAGTSEDLYVCKVVYLFTLREKIVLEFFLPMWKIHSILWRIIS